MTGKVAVARVLVVDDEAALRDSLRRALRSQGHAVEECADVAGALARLAEAPLPEALITDIRLGERSGLELIAEARARWPELPILAITAYGSVEVAVEAMRRGAQDFLEKPFRIELLAARLERLLEPARLRGQLDRLSRENECLRGELECAVDDDELVGGSPALQRLRERLERVAPSGASVLIRGESGTGKELVARRLHRLSGRVARPFVAFNCSAVADTLAESELFGHERGAFTGADRRRLGRFELADGGSLFLDEVGDLSPTVQVKLLRVLQERSFERLGGSVSLHVDVRVIAATNRDLESALREGRFRDDLYYRLNVVTLELPPLRARPEDVRALARVFLTRYGSSQRPLSVTPEALQALERYAWPGNVRQLENVIQRGALLSSDGVIRPEDIELELATADAEPTAVVGQDLRATLARVERDLVERALRASGGNLSAAARALGIERNLLRYKLRKHGLRS